MPTYKICKSFTIESGHMLSKHPERCRYPHGHTRTVEFVLESDHLNAWDMVVDFKALKLAVKDEVNRFDHRMALNSADPTLSSLRTVHPDSVIEFVGQDPTTEVLAKHFYDFTTALLGKGSIATSPEGGTYEIPAQSVRLIRVRVTETPSSWAEYGD